MDEIRCGEPDCAQMATPETIVEMGNLTGGMLAGLFPRPREYRCPSGHITTLRTILDDVKETFEGTRNDQKE